MGSIPSQGIKILHTAKKKKKKKLRKNSFSYVSTGFLAGGSFQGKFRDGPPFKQFFWGIIYISLVFSGDSDSKESTSNAGDLGLIPGSGRSPGEGNGNPLHYSCLENPMDRGAQLATVHGAAKSLTQLSDFHFYFVYHYIHLTVQLNDF